MSPFINDGMTISATIPGREGLYDSFGIDYRPPLSEAVYRWRKSFGTGAEKELQADIEHICKHLKGWTLTPPPDPAILRQLHSLALADILSEINGFNAAKLDQIAKN